MGRAPKGFLRHFGFDLRDQRAAQFGTDHVDQIVRLHLDQRGVADRVADFSVSQPYPHVHDVAQLIANGPHLQQVHHFAYNPTRDRRVGIAPGAGPVDERVAFVEELPAVLADVAHLIRHRHSMGRARLAYQGF